MEGYPRAASNRVEPVPVEASRLARGRLIEPLVIGRLLGRAVIVVMLLLLSFLDSPFHSDVGGLRPAAMERSLRIVDEALAATGRQVPFPCDAEGAPL